MARKQLNPYDPASDGPLRVSKSSFETYLLCPRKFWFDYLIFYDQSRVYSDAAERGKLIHSVMEHGLTAVQKSETPIPEAIETAAIESKTSFSDLGIATMTHLLSSMAEDYAPLIIEALEMKLVVFDQENEADLVGIIDGLFRHPDGGLIIVELKTGNVNSSKMSKFRRELAFYRRVLSLHPDWEHEEVTHYCVIAPDCSDSKLVTSMLSQKRQKRDIYLGDTQGVCIVEPVQKRGINGLEKKLSKGIEAIKSAEWPIKWNDYFCVEWCDYHNSCENEMLTGVSVFGD